MKQYVDFNESIRKRKLSNVREVLTWKRLCLITKSLSRNQNAIDHPFIEEQNTLVSDRNNEQDLLNTSFSSVVISMHDSFNLHTNIDNEIEIPNSILLEKRQRQHDRYMKYRCRLGQSQLYSLIVSSNNIVCYASSCQPSVFTASYLCRIKSTDKSFLMNDQYIKENNSYLSLTNLSDLIDREPTVSRKNSYTQSTNDIIKQKPSLFLFNLFNKMTYEQRAKSISALNEIHENLAKSNSTLHDVHRTGSLPNLATKLHSATSLLSEKSKYNVKSSAERKSIDKNLLNFSNDACFNEQWHFSKIKSYNLANTEEINVQSSKVINGIKSAENHDMSKESNRNCEETEFSTNNLLEKPLNSSPLKLMDSQPQESHSLIQSSKSFSANPYLSIDHSTYENEALFNPNVANDDTNNENGSSKSNNGRSKCNSLRFARDSLELLRHSTPHCTLYNEQLITNPNRESILRIRKSVLKSRSNSSDNLPTPELISYVAVDQIDGDKCVMEEHIRRRSLTIGGGTIISCTSPKPKRDSLILLQERYSGSVSPNSGCHPLSNSDSRHVEFIHEPGNTITPALHIGRGLHSSKHSLYKLTSYTHSNHDQQHSRLKYKIKSSARPKSETSLVIHYRQRPHMHTRSQHSSLISVARTQTPLTLVTPSIIDTDLNKNQKICIDRNDYDKMIRMLLTPLSKKKKKQSLKSIFMPNIEICINNHVSAIQNFIFLLFLIIFYLFIFVKSQYWSEYNQK